jgi:hypothetical protein
MSDDEHGTLCPGCSPDRLLPDGGVPDSQEGPTRVMVDIETLGLEPGCAILSIGAVEFDDAGPCEQFYRSISLESCTDAGLTVDGGTLEWWLERDESVKGVLEGGDDLADVLEAFAAFYGNAEEIWANAPSFDCKILEAAYDAVDVVPPWEFYEERCYRTLKNCPGAVELEREGDHHDALDDAIHQAQRASLTLAGWSE